MLVKTSLQLHLLKRAQTTDRAEQFGWGGAPPSAISSHVQLPQLITPPSAISSHVQLPQLITPPSTGVYDPKAVQLPQIITPPSTEVQDPKVVQLPQIITRPSTEVYDPAADKAGVGVLFGTPPSAPTTAPATTAAPNRPATVTDITGSLGADVTRPFQSGAMLPTPPSAAGAAPSAAPVAPTTPARQSKPVGTGLGAANVAQVSRWTPGNLSGRPYGQHAALPGMNPRQFPTMGGRQFHQSDLGVPTGTETMNPNGANHNWWGWGSSAEQAGRNLTAANTHGMHNIALGKGGVQHGTNGNSQFFDTNGVETGVKLVDPTTGEATLHSMYGGGSSRVGPDERRGIDWSRGSVKDENGMPWKPAAPGQKEQPRQFAQRMAQNAPGIVPPAPTASAAPARPARMNTPGGQWVPPEHRTGSAYRPLEPNPAGVKA